MPISNKIEKNEFLIEVQHGKHENVAETCSWTVVVTVSYRPRLLAPASAEFTLNMNWYS
jgi:hypothetical protein